MVQLSQKKYFTPLRILYPFIKSFVNPLVDISLTFPDRSIRFFSVSKLFVFFFSSNYFSLFVSFSSKYVFFTKSAKSAIWSLVANFVCFNLEVKRSNNIPSLNSYMKYVHGTIFKLFLITKMSSGQFEV